jgi:hypothetical protein
MSAAHTPGPWKVFPGSTQVVRDQGDVVGETICEAENCNAFVQNEARNQANARLIAAAPEMLEALRAVLLFYSVDWTAEKRAEWDRLTGGEATTRVLCDTVRRVLAKLGEHVEGCRCPECDPDFNDPRAGVQS